jgi:hypothetical protein
MAVLGKRLNFGQMAVLGKTRAVLGQTAVLKKIMAVVGQPNSPRKNKANVIPMGAKKRLICLTLRGLSGVCWWVLNGQGTG